MNYCSKCVYPFSAVNLDISDDICSACKFAEQMLNMPDTYWKGRQERFRELLLESRSLSESNYDCLIPVSGGIVITKLI